MCFLHLRLQDVAKPWRSAVFPHSVEEASPCSATKQPLTPVMCFMNLRSQILAKGAVQSFPTPGRNYHPITQLWHVLPSPVIAGHGQALARGV